MKVIKLVIVEHDFDGVNRIKQTLLFTSLEKAKEFTEKYLENTSEELLYYTKISAHEMRVKNGEYYSKELYGLFEGSDFMKKSERDSSSTKEFLEKLAKLKEQIELNK